MKYAIVKVASCFASCPQCGDDLCEPMTGAFLLSIPDHQQGDEFPCQTCGKFYRLPPQIFGKAKP